MKASIPISSVFLLLSFFSFAQKKAATVSGRIVDEAEVRLAGVSITILGQQKGITASDSGTFILKVPADRAFALVFSHSGYKTVQQNFLLNEGEEEKITVRMEAGAGTMEEVIVKDQRERAEVGLIRPNPKTIINLPSPIMGVEGLLKVFVGSN
ncbi:MAG TPA: carboxypeptidase-like regulatory domain-containing protein, partial [Flavisolibacter sp.]